MLAFFHLISHSSDDDDRLDEPFLQVLASSLTNKKKRGTDWLEFMCKKLRKKVPLMFPALVVLHETDDERRETTACSREDGRM